MVKRRMILVDPKEYGTRMLRAGDAVTMTGPKARLYESMGWAEPASRARRPQLDHDDSGKEGGSRTAGGDLSALRQQYFTKLGKRPFNGWDAATLRSKIAAAK